jgi:hypothetical protein
MTKKNNRRKTSSQPDRPVIQWLIKEAAEARAGHAFQHRPDYKRRIERFFRRQSFPPKSVKKPSKEQSGRVLRLCELNALVEAMKRRGDDQKREHRRTLRKPTNRK